MPPGSISAESPFWTKETFTDLPEGSRREADLVAQVYSVDGQPELILVHVEVQTQRRSEFAYRMFEYYVLLRLRHKVPVFPVVVYLAPGAGGLIEERYEETLFGRNVLTFRYQAVGVPDLPSDDYLEQDNPLGAGLSALMRPGRTGLPLRKALSLRRAEESSLDEARKSLLVNLIDAYLRLNAQEETEFRQLLGQPGFEEVKQVVTSFEQRGIEQGIEQGINEGIIRGKRDTLLKIARSRFGDLTADLSAAVEGAGSAEELDLLLERILGAANPADVTGPQDGAA